MLRVACAILFFLAVQVGHSSQAAGDGPSARARRQPASVGTAAPQTGAPTYFRPRRRIPPSLEPILRHVKPGGDGLADEHEAEVLTARLSELGRLLRDRAASRVADRLLTPEFRGGRLTSREETSLGGSPSLEIFRLRSLPSTPALDRQSFVEELGNLVAEFQTLAVTEFLITEIDVVRDAQPSARTVVRYDLVGSGARIWRSERLGHWQMRWRRDADSWRITEWTALDHVRSRAAAPVFTEVTGTALGEDEAFQRQLRPPNDAWLSSLDSALSLDTMGLHGMSVGDADGDGLDDMYIAQPSGLPNRLFRNRGDGRFEDATERSGLAVLDSTSQSLFADVDNDRDQDLVLVTRTGLLLFTNDGKGHFRREADAFDVKARLRGSPTAIAMADYDRDGFLDLYLCTYSYFIGASEDKAGPATPYHDAQNGPPNVLFRNDGRGRFVDVTDQAGLNHGNDRFSLAAAWADYDADGWPDLLVANDFGRKNLYRNQGMSNGKVTFKDVAAQAGVEDHGAGMSATWLDYDNDGFLDIYTGNMWSAAGLRITNQRSFMPHAPPDVRRLYQRHARGNSLFRNRGDGTFADVTLETRTDMGRWAWSSDAIDFDLDGWDDLYVVNGMFTRGNVERDLDSFFWRQVVARSPLTWQPGTSFDDGWRAINRMLVANEAQASHERNVFLRNNGRGGFDEVSGAVGLDIDQDGRSFVAFDCDRDGDADLALFAPRSSPQLRIFRNDFREQNASLVVRLVGNRSNRDAIGARVVVETEQGRRTKIVSAGSGFLSQQPKELIFGLGTSHQIETVTVVWPSGLTQKLSRLPVNHRVWIEEGSDAVRMEPFTRHATGAAATLIEARDSAALPVAATWLYEPFPAPDFTLRDLRGQDQTLLARRGSPSLVLFWTSKDPASKAALVALGRHRKALVEAGASVLAVAFDSPSDEAAVRAAADGVDVPVAIASDELSGVYAVVNRFLFGRREDVRLPTLLLVGTTREIVRVYRDRIDMAAVRADIANADTAPAERLARAVPFGGTFYTVPEGRNYFQYALDLGEQGFDAQALDAFETVARREPSAITFYNLGTLHMKAGQPSEAKAAFERALELKPQYAEVSNSLGALMAQGGDLDGAIARFRAAVEIKPDYPDALNNLGYALFQAGQHQEALGLYRKALQLRPEFPEALNNVGIFHGQNGDLAAAEASFGQALEQRADYGEAATNLALVVAARGDTEGAVRILEQLLKDNPAFEAAYLTLCRLHMNAGQRSQAVQALERLLQRNPTHPVGLQIWRDLRGRR